MRIVDLYGPPKMMSLPIVAHPRIDRRAQPDVPRLGVVIRSKQRRAWRGRVESLVRSAVDLAEIEICERAGTTVRVNVPQSAEPHVGEVVRVVPAVEEFDGASSLYADAVEAVEVPEAVVLKAAPGGGSSPTQPAPVHRNVSPGESAGREQAAILDELRALATGCPLSEVAQVIRRHVDALLPEAVDGALFRVLRDAFKKDFDKGNHAEAAGWMLAMELVPFQRYSSIDWRIRKRETLVQSHKSQAAAARR